MRIDYSRQYDERRDEWYILMRAVNVFCGRKVISLARITEEMFEQYGIDDPLWKRQFEMEFDEFKRVNWYKCPLYKLTNAFAFATATLARFVTKQLRKMH